jgi:hypothetical protein
VPLREGDAVGEPGEGEEEGRGDETPAGEKGTIGEPLAGGGRRAPQEDWSEPS